MMGKVLCFCIFATVLLVCAGTDSTAKTPTVYDVLQLVYQICSTKEEERIHRLVCVNSHMGKEVVSALDSCMERGSLQSFCQHLTHVPQWASKHPQPPTHLTRVMGLAALGRMACVLSQVQRPLPMWQAAFSKCFPEYQSVASLKKDSSSKNRGENTINF